jgi:hypothetical protein
MSCHIMSCHVMLCYICHVMPCYVMLCYVMLCYVMLCYVMLCCHVMSCVMSCLMSCYVVLCNAMLCYVILCCLMSCCVVSCLVISCCVTLRYVTLRYVTMIKECKRDLVILRRCQSPYKLQPEDGFMKAETYSCCVLVSNFILRIKAVIDYRFIYFMYYWKHKGDATPENSNWLFIILHSTSVWATDTVAKLP